MYKYKIKNKIKFTIEKNNYDDERIITIKFGNHTLKTCVFRNNNNFFEYISTSIDDSDGDNYIEVNKKSGWAYILYHVFRDDVENDVFDVYFYTLCSKTFDLYSYSIEMDHHGLIRKTVHMKVDYNPNQEIIIYEPISLLAYKTSKWHAILEYIVKDTMDIFDRVTIYP